MEQIVLFMIVSFALALVVILKKDALPASIRKPLALVSIFMVATSFIMLVISLYQMGL
jgi:DMSO/TMAO reductase YedYZ heme-binding membrane subunit